MSMLPEILMVFLLLVALASLVGYFALTER